jgi:outer membrane autotransporter protein
VSDRRHGLDNRGRAGTATVGLDRKLTDDIVVGASLGVQKSWSHGFGGFTHAESDGITIGPYVAVRLSPNWAAEVSFSYADNKRDAHVVSLSSQYRLQAYTGSATLHGQYVVNEWHLRPKITVSYMRNVSRAHDLTGTVLGLPLSLHFPTAMSHFGFAEAYGEVSRLFSFPNGIHMIPYLELGVHYAFDRPNNGERLTGSLLTFIPSPWVGSMRSGARMQLPGNTLVEASVGYLSFGQNDLQAWEGKLRLSVGF